jgi:glycosyltransferase involved in cell wall biosynthesis
MSPDLSVIILTLNEERNLPQALDSVCGWARQVFVFDSFSTDRTLDIAREKGCVVVQHRFENFGKQRNAALDELPITSEWVMFLDADEWLPKEFKEDLGRVISAQPRENGFYCKRRVIWMGGWIRRGYYPTWILRLFRRGKARCEERSVNEHLIIDGSTGFIQADYMHEDHNGLDRWIDKHNAYATREAVEAVAAEKLLEHKAGTYLDLSPFGTQEERARWLRERVWNRMPPVARPFAYFGYRYVVRGGFLDGIPGLTFHFMQGLWYPILIDLKYLELKQSVEEDSSG